MTNPFYTIIRRLRSPLIALIIVYAISILGYVLIPGVDDKGEVWNMSFFHAFYFVSFMSTTIGFGEIPYEFTNAQRYWTLITLYATVVTWLYGIGVLLSVFQDKIFLNQLKKNTFSRSIKRFREPFYIICGYGDTGAQLTRLIAEQGIPVVVIDSKEERIHELESDDFHTKPLGICEDASQSEVLELAGIKHPFCEGIISIVNDDTVNLTVAIVAQLLNPKIRLITRAETPEAEANILSFGANEIINPFEIFASRLSLAMNAPSMYCLHHWLTGAVGEKIEEPPVLKSGTWIICNFGRFGRALYNHLDNEKTTLRFIESDRRSHDDLPAGTVIGRATEAPSLRKAGIQEAVGIIASTNNDANNLSTILTASELNPELFRVVRQNRDKNHHLFQCAEYEMIMQRGSIIANTIFAFIRTPMLGDFLRIVSRFKEDKTGELVSRIIGVVDDDVPKLWEFQVNELETPALYKVIQSRPVQLGNILYSLSQKLSDNNTQKQTFDNHEKNINALCLFMKRAGNNILLPEDIRFTKENDRFLMCGTRDTHRKMQYLLNDIDELENVLSNKPITSSIVWRYIDQRWKNRKKRNG